ncbi:MAG: carboxypeptidase regulatory-like domain-containing protein, partial [Candidatus Hydrogenedentes bacterium]|nr:carboxypeptidase regulatory-like domain-containing protein [Candidatus Hydrogenedentota bacterium]
RAGTGQYSRFAVSARKGGLSAVTSTALTDDELEGYVKLELRPAGAISGRVIDKNGDSIEGAWVMPEEKQGQRGYNSNAATAQRARSDADGAFTVQDLSEGKWKLVAVAAGYALAQSDYLPLGTKNAVIQLSQGGSASGEVVSSPGNEPVEGILVKLTGEKSRRNVATAHTDAGGAFTLAGLAADRYQLVVDDPTRVALGAEVSFTLAEEETKEDLKLSVALGGVITGRVYDAGTEEPLSGARITASGGMTRDAYADGEGFYKLEGLAAGSYRLRRRWFPGYLHGEQREDKNMAVALGQVIEGVDFAVKKGLYLRGIVVDVSGNPIDRVMVQSEDLSGNNEGETTETRQDGTWEHRGFSGNSTVRITAQREGFAAPPIPSLTFQGQDINDVKIVMDRGGSIAGVVVDKSGKGLLDYYVMAQPMNSPEAQPQGTESREGGAFKIEGLMPATYSLSARSTNQYRRTKPIQEVTVAKGEAVDGVRLVIDDEQGLTISGRVMNKDKQPIRDASIQANRVEGEGWGHAQSDSEGNYEILGLEEGEYMLRLYHQTYSGAEREGIAAGAKNIDFVLEGRGAVEGNVVASTGGALQRFELMHLRGAHEDFMLAGGRSSGMTPYMDENGHFLLPQVEAGDATIVARAPGYAPATTVVRDVREGETVSGVVIRLEPAAAIDGIVLDGAGRPLAGASVYMNWMPPDSYSRTDQIAATSDAEGRFYIDSLNPGPVRLFVSHSDYAVASVEVTLEGAGATPVEVRLSTGGAIEGTVTVGGVRTAGVNIAYIQDGGGSNGQAVTDANGAYRIDGVPAGNITVTGHFQRDAGNRSISREAVVESDQVTVVDLEFVIGTTVIEGYVTVNGAPPNQEGMAVFVISGDATEPVMAQLQSNGFFRLEGLPAGEGTLHVQLHSGEAPMMRMVQVRTQEGQTTRQDVELNAGTRLRGTVSGMREHEHAQVIVLRGQVQVNTLAPETWRELAPLMAGAAMVTPDGTFETSGLETGTYTVVAYSMGQSLESARVTTQTIEIQEGQEVELNITLP